MSGTSRHKKSRSNRAASSLEQQQSNLFDDFHDTTSTRFDQNRSIVDDRVAILSDTVLLRDLVIGHARFRKLGAYPYIALITVGRAALLLHRRRLLPTVPPTIAP